ncbi:MAG: hypothetical protein JXB25_09220, partial [Deltaproteobacteria bacterium]|nr:hypothetical protein [Deltaproteobacteria bacterium]
MEKVSNLVLLAEALKEKPLEDCQTVSRRHLVDKLNSISNQNGNIFLTFRHSQHPHSLSVKACPEPCSGETLRLKWDSSHPLAKKLQDYRFDHFLLDDGLKLLLVQAEHHSLDQDGLVVNLPEQAREIRARRARRHACHGVGARFLQHSVQFEGNLENFSPGFCRVNLQSQPGHRLSRIDPGSAGYLILLQGDETLFSGKCLLTRQGYGEHARDFVFELDGCQTGRIRTEDFPNNQQRLTPAPQLIFNHPLTGENVSLAVEAISGSGFSVEEEKKEALLFPGLVLPSLTLSLADTLTIPCRAQVIGWGAINEEEPVIVRHRVVILDIASPDRAKLEAHLKQSGGSDPT